MRKKLNKLGLQKYLALFLSIVLVLSSVTSVRAIDFIHSDENRHYLVYNDINALSERIVNAYETNNYAILGENIFLPLVDGNEVEEGEDYLIDILDNLAGKYLIDTVPVMDNLTVYLTADIDTLEFYLLVSNNTDSEHFVTLVFADGMEFESFAMNYSFTLAEEELKDTVEEEIKDVDENETGEIDEIEDTEENDTPTEENNTPTEENQNAPTSEDGENQNAPTSEDGDNLQVEDKEIIEVSDPIIGNDPVDELNDSPNEIDEDDIIRENQSDNVRANNTAMFITRFSTLINEDNGCEGINEDTDEDISEDGDEDINEDIDEDINEDGDEGIDEENNEDGDEENNEDGDEENNEDGDEENNDDVIEDDKTEEDLEEPIIGKILIGRLLNDLVMSKNSISLLSTPSSATSVGFRYNASDYPPTISKIGVDNGDGTYNITLSVNGNNEIVTKEKPIDLVLAIDVSNSMYWAMNNKTLQVGFDANTEPQHYRFNNTNPQSRWGVLQEKVTEIINSILKVNGSKVSIVMYSGDNKNTNGNWSNLNYSILSDWSNNAGDIISTYTGKELHELTHGPNGQFYNYGGSLEGAGGTNGSAGFYAAGLQLEKVKNDSNPNYLIYISDGIANRYIKDINNPTEFTTNIPGYSDNTDAWFQQIALKTISFAKKVKSDYSAKIYTIGMSESLDITNPNGYRIGGYLMNPTGDNKYQESYYTAANSSQLSNALTEIRDNISGKALTDLVVKDQLSKYVTYVDNSLSDSNASIDENGLITWNVADNLTKSETRYLTYKVKVNNVTTYQDVNKLTPQANYVDTDNNLIGYYENEKIDEKYYFHSNDYARLEYNDINGDPAHMDFEHPVVKPSAKPYTLIINKAIREGDEVPEGISFDFLIKIGGSPYNGKVVINSREIKVVDGKLSLKANEKAYLYVEGNIDGTLPYEITELEYVNDLAISKLVDVSVVEGNGTKVGNTVSGTIGNNESIPSTKLFYMYTTTRSNNKNTFTWFSSSDGIKNWVNTGITETTTATTPSIPAIFGTDFVKLSKYYDLNNELVTSTTNITLDYYQDSSISGGTPIQVKNVSSGIIFSNATNRNANTYDGNNYYMTKNTKSTLSEVLTKLGSGYTKVGYDQSKMDKKNYRTVYFYNPVVLKDIYEVTTKATTKPKTTITELTFINSYELLYGSIAINKSINDYYYIHGNPVFLYRLDKMDGDTVIESSYDFIEFKIDEIDYKIDENPFVVDGEVINSKSSNIAASILFDNLTPGTYRVTEIQPIRYELDKWISDSGTATIGGDGNAIIVIKATNKDVELTYFNEKVNNNNFSHTDVVRNTFTIAKGTPK